ncbi:MAG: hypothetical protein EOM58_12195, partial [Clostridia bacterium]|nr:hypothetical protein [Clostridia bacterium]
IGQFIYPHDVAVDGAGFVYVTDENNHRVQKFTGGGTYITSWGSLGSGEGQFSAPTGITVDISGNVYVADNQNHRIQKFTDNGIFITSWGMQGSDEGQLYWPWGIEVDDAGGDFLGGADQVDGHQGQGFRERQQQLAPREAAVQLHVGLDHLVKGMAEAAGHIKQPDILARPEVGCLRREVA